MTWYLLLMTLLSMGSNHSNNDGRIVYPTKGTIWEINFIWTHSMCVPSSVHESFSQSSYIWKKKQKTDLTDEMKRSFFQAAVVWLLLYGCTSWTLTKRMEKKLDGNYTRMMRAILNKSWRQHPRKPQVYGHLLPITKTIKVRRSRHVGHCWRSRDELISDVFILNPSYGRKKAVRPARTYI